MNKVILPIKQLIDQPFKIRWAEVGQRVEIDVRTQIWFTVSIYNWPSQFTNVIKRELYNGTN